MRCAACERELHRASRLANGEKLAAYCERRYWGRGALKHRVERSFRERATRIARNREKRADEGFVSYRRSGLRLR
jgi:hypothetical protein